MGVCVRVNEFGQLVTNGEAIESCTQYVVMDSVEYGYISASYVLTPADALYLYTWGFGAILMPWAIAYAISAAKKVVKLT